MYSLSTCIVVVYVLSWYCIIAVHELSRWTYNRGYALSWYMYYGVTSIVAVHELSWYMYCHSTCIVAAYICHGICIFVVHVLKKYIYHRGIVVVLVLSWYKDCCGICMVVVHV